MTTYKKAFEESLKYFNGDEIAANVFLTKYALTNPESGDLLEMTPDSMHKRLAKEFARIEAKYPNPMSEEEIYGLLKNFKYVIPQGSPMAGIGNPYQVTSLSNCFLAEMPLDSYGSIMHTDQQLAQISKRRGGVGIDLSNIRPKGLPTKNASKTTDGIALFMERFSNTIREVGQAGRRGALMQTLSVHHPEIETFIKIKRDLKKVTGANISIRLSDAFLQAVEDGTNYVVQFPVGEPDPAKCLVYKHVSARALWAEIMESAWQSAEPGLLFWDTVIKRSPADCYADVGYKTVSTNPCSELTLSELDSCRLMLQNLASFVLNPFTKEATFDFDLFKSISYKAQRLMDDMVDLELEKIQLIIDKVKSDPEPDYIKAPELSLWEKIYKTAENGRRTGLGITALGDTLAYLGLRYGSDESIAMTEEIYRTLAIASYKASVDMAEERGAFPVYSYDKEKNHEFILDVMNEDLDLKAKWAKVGRRNIANLTTAPAGSVSIECQTTSGIEPAFMVQYKRRKKITSSDEVANVDFIDDLGDKWQEFTVYHHGFKKWMEVTGFSAYEDSPYFKSMSGDVDWEAKVRLQGAAQKWVDHAISCTVNVPNETTVETVQKIYSTGWKSGCKGLTIYRDGSRSGVLVSDEPKKEVVTKTLVDNFAPKRPEILPCDIYHFTVKGEKWNAFVGLFEGRPYEIFAGRAEYISIPKSKKTGRIKKNGAYNVIIGEGENEIIIKDMAHVFENSTESAFTRTISLALRHGTPVQFVVEQLDKGASKENEMFSLSKGLMRVLKSYIKDGTAVVSTKKCPSCGASDSLVYQDGCMLCSSCGDSKCG